MIPADATAIGGLTMGADPVAFGVAAVAADARRTLRSFSVRKEAKDHGVTGRIAGALEPGDRVVITEDTVTRGTSLMEAVDVVRAFGAEPVLIIVIVDRGGTCAAMAAAAGVPYRPLLTRDPDPRASTFGTLSRRRSDAGTRGVQYLGEHARIEHAGGVEGALTAATAASSAGVRTRCSHGVLAMPTPCSAEIVPPSSAAAASTSAVIASRVARLEDVDVDVALGEVTERHQPAAVGGDRAAHGGEQRGRGGRPARRRRASAARPGAPIDSVMRSRNATRCSRAGPRS